jgi:hypothetical protein
MKKPWFSNKGQVIQVICAVSLLVLAVSSVVSRLPSWFWIVGPVLILIWAVLALLHWLGWIQRMDFSVQDLYPVYEPQAGYKLKLRLVLRNDCKLSLDVRKPRWLRPDDNDLHIQSPLASSFNLERMEMTGGRWEPETEEVHVRPGQRFRVWIGIDDNRCTYADLKARIQNRTELGTLEFPIFAVAQELKLTVRVQSS